MDLEILGKKLKAVRKDQGLILRQVQEVTGIPHENLSKYENGRKGMNLNTFYRLCKFYGCSADNLLGFYR